MGKMLYNEIQEASDKKTRQIEAYKFILAEKVPRIYSFRNKIVGTSERKSGSISDCTSPWYKLLNYHGVPLRNDDS